MLKDKNLIKELEVLETLNEKELREIAAGYIILNPIGIGILNPIGIGTWPTPERSISRRYIDTVPLPE